MTLPAASSAQLHCHHCTRWLGEASVPLTFVGMFKHLEDRNLVAEPRTSYRCKSCGWVNVFRPESAAALPSWRTVELKQETGVSVDKG